MSTNAFSFSENFSGVKPAGDYVRMPEGPFKGKITAIEVDDKKDDPGAKVATVTVSVTEPGYEGASRRRRLRLPDATETGQNSKAFWRALLESVGYTAAQLDTGAALTITQANFIGKDCHVYHKPAPEGVKGQYDEIEFITPTSYAERKRGAAARGGAATNVQVGGQSLGQPGVTPQPPNSGPVNADALKASLLA